jgi:hypothetical protein
MPFFLAALAIIAIGAGVLGYEHFRSFGGRVLDKAKRDLGVSQTGNPGRVLQMVGNYGYSSIVEWCAAAVGTWIREAAVDAGITPPVAGSASALNTASQFQDASNPRVGWYSASQLVANPSLISPGMIAFWHRGDPSSYEGHTGVVATADGVGGWTSIEGNAGPTGGVVATESHDLSSPNFIGMGFFR